MAFIENIPETDIATWRDAYDVAGLNPKETRSFLVEIKDFEALLEKIKLHNAVPGNETVKAIRMYFIRTFDLPCAQKGDILSVDDVGKIAQMSGVILPVINFKPNSKRQWEADDLYVDGKTFGILPGDNIGTAHHPPGPKSKTGV